MFLVWRFLRRTWKLFILTPWLSPPSYSQDDHVVFKKIHIWMESSHASRDTCLQSFPPRNQTFNFPTNIDARAHLENLPCKRHYDSSTLMPHTIAQVEVPAFKTSGPVKGTKNVNENRNKYQICHHRMHSFLIPSVPKNYRVCCA